MGIVKKHCSCRKRNRDGEPLNCQLAYSDISKRGAGLAADGEGAGGRTAKKQDKKVGGAESFALFCIGKMFACFA